MAGYAGYGCEVLFDVDRAEMLQGIIEGATGQLCPCKRGLVCPLLPAKSPQVAAVTDAA